MECCSDGNDQTVKIPCRGKSVFHPVNPVHPVKMLFFQLHDSGLGNLRPHAGWQRNRIMSKVAAGGFN